MWLSRIRVKKQGLYFQIKIETAPNLNKIKFEISSFLPEFEIFQISNQLEFLDFLKKMKSSLKIIYFSKWIFFLWNGGAGPDGPAQARPRLPTIHRKKIHFEKYIIFNEDFIFFKKSMNSSWFEIWSISNSSKKDEISILILFELGAVSILIWK